MATSGLTVVQRVLERLRKPSDRALPYQTVLRTVAEKMSQYKLDLSLSDQNGLLQQTRWFTPSKATYALDDAVFPVKVEMRAVGSDGNTEGRDVPIVNYTYLNNSPGAVSFYGTPTTIFFNDSIETISNYQYRVSYEGDFADDITLDTDITIPDFFVPMLVLESAYDLLDLVEDSSPEWMQFSDAVQKKWWIGILDHRERWQKYVKTFKGKSQILKKTFWNNNCRRRNFRENRFR